MNKKILSVSILLQFVIASAHAELSAHELMVKNEDIRKLQDIHAEAKLVSGGGSSSEKFKDFTFWRKLSTDAVHYSTLTRFHTPAEVRDEGVLILENSTGVNDVLLYLPAYKKIRRVESQQQSGSFMGTAFSYSDIAAPHVDDYSYRDEKTENCPTPDSAAIKCRVIEGKPANDRVKERTGYTKAQFWVRADNFMVVQAMYDNLEGKTHKRLTAQDLRKVDEKNGKWMAFDVRVENLFTHEWTNLKFGTVAVNRSLTDSVFTQQNLSTIK